VLSTHTKKVFPKKNYLLGVNDYVTKADVNSHCSIAFSLWRLFPNLNLISEEDVQKKSCPDDIENFDLDPSALGNVELPDINVRTDELTLFIDPLDATKEFTEKLFKYVSVMICVADKKGDPLIGVIYFPFSKRLYWGWKGHGVSENLLNVKADLDDEVQNPIAIVSLSHAGEVKEFVKSKLGERTSIVQAAGSGYKIIQVSSWIKNES
jgi:inositol monophosphatase 3